MNCGACGFDNPSGMSFCGKCGAALARTCPSCGFDCPPDFAFCGKCGRPLSGEAAPAAAAPERAPRDYTPTHLAERILASKSALEGERKQVTVLFADVKGSMELAEGLDPEAWHHVLERFFEILSEGVHRYEGTVNQYTGDGIMALFGAPIAHEDHAQRACWAALHLRDALRSYADDLRMLHGLNFSVRMGLNSGEVVVGKIGDDLRMDYTAQGQSVGLAARMEQLADGGQALLTEHTARLVEGYFELRDLGAARVKGVSQPVGVSELIGPGAQRTRLDRSRARGFSRFVGRVAERATLEAALEHALEGNGQVVGIVAEAGTGKSRLCAEFLDSVRRRGIRVQEGTGLSHGRNVPMLAALQLVRNIFGVEERDTDQAARDKIAGRIVLGDEALTEELPLVFDFMGVPDPRRPAPQLDPEERQRRLFDVVRRMVRARSRHEPGVLLMEDLHWLDEASEVFVGHLTEAAPGTRTLVLVNYRPEYAPRWASKSWYQQLPLQPLGPDDVRELLVDLLGSDPSHASLAERIQEWTGGNPFFVEEVVQMLHEEGALEGRRGAFRLVRPVEELTPPPSVQGVLAARIDRLGDTSKQALQAASVVGSSFARSLLGRVSELEGEALDAAVRALIEAELIYEEYLYPEPEYAFKHPLVRSVAYDAQLSEHRTRRHAAAARAIEDSDAAKLDERAALVAQHWEGADEPLRAAKWHRRAAVWAGRARKSDAAAAWKRVRALTPADEVPPEALELGMEARASLVLLTRGQGLDVDAIIEEVHEMARRGGSQRLEVRALLASGIGRLFHGRVGDAQADLGRALELALETDEDLVSAVLPIYCISTAASEGPLRAAGRVIEYRHRFDHRPDHGRATLGISPAAAGMAYRGFYLCQAGQCELGRTELQHGLDMVHQQGDPGAIALAEFNAVCLFLELGEPDAAMAHAAHAIQTPDEAVAVSLALAHAAAGRFAEAEEEFARRLPQGPQLVADQWLHVRARGWHELGQSERAIEALREGSEQARELGATANELRMRLALATILTEAEGGAARDEIERLLARAEELIERTASHFFSAAIHEARAGLARALGDADAHDRELAEARRLYQEMGAPARAAALPAPLL